jgi:hypothetical protein
MKGISLVRPPFAMRFSTVVERFSAVRSPLASELPGVAVFPLVGEYSIDVNRSDPSFAVELLSEADSLFVVGTSLTVRSPLNRETLGTINRE